MKHDFSNFRPARGLILALLTAQLSACNAMGNLMNPFYEPPPEYATMGEANDDALASDSGKESKARAALEAMATYRRAHMPEPQYPVVQPAVVRLMWVPDHVNKSGDMVPAHYYYLKVLSDRWAVQDAFELERQLKGGSQGSELPYVLETDRLN